MNNKLVERNFNAMAVEYQLHLTVQAAQSRVFDAAVDVDGDSEQDAAVLKGFHTFIHRWLQKTGNHASQFGKFFRQYRLCFDQVRAIGYPVSI